MTESQVVAPAVPVTVQTIAPVGAGPVGEALTTAEIIKVSPRTGEAGVVLKVILGVAGPTTTLIGVAGYCATEV